MKSSSKFDIVVYGATGFTGQLVAEYLAAHYRGDKQLKWAMAGRSLDKLKSVRDAIGAAADTGRGRTRITDAPTRSAAPAAIRATAVAALVVALVGLLFALVRQPSIHRWPSLVIYGAAWAVFGSALWLLRRVPLRAAVVLILIGIRHCREITTFDCVGTPFTLAASVTSPVPRPAGSIKLIW